MKDLNSRIKALDIILEGLVTEFGVYFPKLSFKSMRSLHGFYASDKITINLNTLHNNLAEASRTLRHEFYHFLEDILSLDESKSELKAKRFEKGQLCGILPKSQRKLLPQK